MNGGRSQGEEAPNPLTGITLVGIGLGGSLGDLDIALVDNLVEGVFAATKDLAGITMTTALSAD